MATYNIQIEDSAGNKYHPKPDLLTSKEQVMANTAAGKSVDAQVIKELNNNLTTKMPGQLKLIAEGSGADVKYYAQLGADAASKKRLGDITYLGQFKSTDTNISKSRSFNLSSLPGYRNLSADKLFIEYVSFTSYAARVLFKPILSYDNSSGILTVSNAEMNAYIYECTINVYLKQ